MQTAKPLLLLAANVIFFAALWGQPPIQVPIKLIDKLIVIEARVNYRHTGYFILDTGTSCLSLNSKYFRGDRLANTSINGIHGENTDLETRRIDLEINDQVWKAQKTIIMDLAHLEKVSPVPFKILGLLGADFFKDMELVIDFIDGFLSFYPSKDSRSDHYYGAPFTISGPFREHKGLPVIEVSMGGQVYFMGIDSGAGINVLDQRHLKNLTVYFGESGFSTTKDIGGRGRKRLVTRLSGLSVDDWPCTNMLTLFTDISPLNNKTNDKMLDGLLGLEFIKQGRLSLNFKKQQFTFQFKDNQEAIRSAGLISSNADTSMLIGSPGN